MLESQKKNFGIVFFASPSLLLLAAASFKQLLQNYTSNISNTKKAISLGIRGAEAGVEKRIGTLVYPFIRLSSFFHSLCLHFVYLFSWRNALNCPHAHTNQNFAFFIHLKNLSLFSTLSPLYCSLSPFLLQSAGFLFICVRLVRVGRFKAKALNVALSNFKRNIGERER